MLVLENEENAILNKRLAETETKLVLARMECETAERRLHESRVWNKMFYLDMVHIGSVPKPLSDDWRNRIRKPISSACFSAVTVHNNLPEQIQNAQVEACKEENIGAEGFRGEGEPFEVRSDGSPVSIIRTETLVSASSFKRSLQKSLDNLDYGALLTHPETDWSSERTSFRLGRYVACLRD
ncbi:hypothetical protein Tco_0685160 [Tanacetum coccineum]